MSAPRGSIVMPDIPTMHKEVTRINSNEPNAARNIPGRPPPKGIKGPGASPSSPKESESFIDAILESHARKLMSGGSLRSLGYFAAHLDLHLVSWFKKERDRAAKVEDFVWSLKKLHKDFEWPYPILVHPVSYYLQRLSSECVLYLICNQFHFSSFQFNFWMCKIVFQN